MLGFLAGIIPILIIISLIVTFHELGHFAVARLFKTRVERFSVGFGKILFSRKDKNGVEWCISALPLGGYVKFAGDENITSMMPSMEDLEASRIAITELEGASAVRDYFHFKPLWQRFLIILAGPAANFVLAIGVFTLITMLIGETITPSKVIDVLPNGPAAASGFKPGDLIKSIDGHDVQNDALQTRLLISLRADTRTEFVVQRGAETLTIFATPRRAILDETGKDKTFTGGQMGFHISAESVQRPVTPWRAFVVGNNTTWDTLDTTLTYVGRSFSGRENGSQIGGPLGMAKAAGDLTMNTIQVKAPLWLIAANLLLQYTQLMAYISIGVGFLNLLPIPLLDGGHLAFYAYQSVVKKPIPTGIQNVAFRIAAVLVLGLMLFAFWNDANHTGLVSFFGRLFS